MCLGCGPTSPSWGSMLKTLLLSLDGNIREVTPAVLNVSIVNDFTAVHNRYPCISHMSAGKPKVTVAKTTRFKPSQCSGISLAQHPVQANLKFGTVTLSEQCKMNLFEWKINTWRSSILAVTPHLIFMKPWYHQILKWDAILSLPHQSIANFYTLDEETSFSTRSLG